MRQFGTTEDDGADAFAEANLYLATHGGSIYVSGLTLGDMEGQAQLGLGDVFLARFDALGRERLERSRAASGLTPGAAHFSDAAAEPGHTARRAGRRPGAWPGLRKPRLPPRRSGPHPPALQRQALDRLPARVPRLAAAAAAPARPLHRALLPRRGDRVRRRAPSLRALPARGLRPLRRDLARRCIPARSARTRSTRSCTRERVDPGTRAQRLHDAAPRRASRRRVRPAATARPAWCSAQSCSRWTPAGYAERIAATRRRRGGAGHAAVAGRSPARRLGAARAASFTRPREGVSSPDRAAGRRDPSRDALAVLGRRRRSRSRGRRSLGVSRQHRGLLVLADRGRPVADLHGRRLLRRCVLLHARGSRIALAHRLGRRPLGRVLRRGHLSSSRSSTGTASTTATRRSGPPSRSTPG